MEEVKIYKKALDMMCEYTNVSIDYWLKKAEEELLEEGSLTENQKVHLAQKISNLQNTLNCKITHLRYDNSSVSNKFMKLYTRDYLTETLTARLIIYGTLVSFADDVFACGKTYEIEKLLGYEVAL